MIVYLAIAAWFLFGLAGCVLIWTSAMRFEAQYDKAEPNYCPTPRAILCWMLGSPFGPLIFIASLIICLIDFIQAQPRGWVTWWATPICKPRESK